MTVCALSLSPLVLCLSKVEPLPDGSSPWAHLFLFFFFGLGFGGGGDDALFSQVQVPRGSVHLQPRAASVLCAEPCVQRTLL